MELRQPEQSVLNEYLGAEIVVDVSSPYVFVGTLTSYDHKYLVLENADVHDLRDTNTTRELYVLDSHRHGNRANRSRVLVKFGEVVSISRLNDVTAG